MPLYSKDKGLWQEVSRIKVLTESNTIFFKFYLQNSNEN